ncbi:MAG: hypothetical protein JKX75_09400 [Gammaproteobacteria bacterium]|nr:hypothetical protein [Gammaproteobacteria bacterium]
MKSVHAVKLNTASSLLSKSVLGLVLLFQLAACSMLDNATGLIGNNQQAANNYSASDNDETYSAEQVSGSLSWTAPVAREDNSAISMAEIAGFRIYYGTVQNSYQQFIEVNDAYISEYALSAMNLITGTYYIVMTTIDTDGRESSFSDEVVVSV